MHDQLNEQLKATLATVMIAAATPGGRAVVIREVIEHLATVVAAEPAAVDEELDSLLFLLDAVDAHCWRFAAVGAH